ncbi:hypothetical protein EVA_09432 [gut metagenome]|uniref:Uncharacterized protein n=1 Tax=gut metagenome TaxID=749906 RepID=J9GK52_9ZZZZ
MLCTVGCDHVYRVLPVCHVLVIVHRSMCATNNSSYFSCRITYFMKCLNFATFGQSKVRFMFTLPSFVLE